MEVIKPQKDAKTICAGGRMYVKKNWNRWVCVKNHSKGAVAIDFDVTEICSCHIHGRLILSFISFFRSISFILG